MSLVEESTQEREKCERNPVFMFLAKEFGGVVLVFFPLFVEEFLVDWILLSLRISQKSFSDSRSLNPVQTYKSQQKSPSKNLEFHLNSKNIPKSNLPRKRTHSQDVYVFYFILLLYQNPKTFLH